MLRDIRIGHGLTLQEVAEAAKLSRFTVSAAEKNLAISAVSANKIANALSMLSGQSYTVESLGILVVTRPSVWKTSKIEGTEDE
jgi:transcriptional regulator with XRE-family HTH domain